MVVWSENWYTNAIRGVKNDGESVLLWGWCGVGLGPNIMNSLLDPVKDPT